MLMDKTLAKKILIKLQNIQMVHWTMDSTPTHLGRNWK